MSSTWGTPVPKAHCRASTSREPRKQSGTTARRRGEEPFGLAPVAAASGEMDGLDGQEDRARENGRAREAEAGEHAERREPPCDGFREAKAKSRKRRFGPRRDEHGHVRGENGERCGAEPEEVADGSSHGM